MQHTSSDFPSRRTFITGSALGLTALALAGCERTLIPTAPPVTAGASPTAPQLTTAPTTLERTIVPGAKLDPKKQYRQLKIGAPQSLVVRQDLCRADSARSSRRKPLAAFGHVTDTHIMDPTSPTHIALGAFNSAVMAESQRNLYYFRPQEALTVQVLDAMIRALNTVGRGPVSGRPFDFYISTGDSSDNRGTSEVFAFINVMNGIETSAFAIPGRYDGLQSPITLPADLFRWVWQPMPPKATSRSSSWQDSYGFPTAKNMLSSAAANVSTQGANVPWYSGFGNHDVLAHDGIGPLGTPNADFFKVLATAGKIPLGLPEKTDFASFMKKVGNSTEPQMQELIDSMPGKTVEASTLRRPMSKTEFMSAHMINPGPQGPAGHGFTAENIRSGLAYYRFQLADGIIGLMLDTTDATGGGYGSLDTEQTAWLEKELNSVSAIHYDAQGTQQRSAARNQLAVIFSHHPSTTFSKKNLGNSAKGDITSPEAIRELLGRYPNVILWVNGHLHKNVIWPRPSSQGDYGFWEVSTASHIDFPQQSRSVEIIDNQDGTLSVAGVMIDHSDALKIDYDGHFTSAELAAFSAELAMNAPGLSVTRTPETDKDQNVELLLKKPF